MASWYPLFTPGVGAAAASVTGFCARVWGHLLRERAQAQAEGRNSWEAILTALRQLALSRTGWDLRQVTHLLANLWHSGSMSSEFRERFKGLIHCA